mmetsp:Transcript_9512/g.13147  ORF Transcript_9512/g.13147 Transcript_9512/m.13147 type:complete len:260 (+) Transcript_9512:400-1179(+)
MKLALVVRLDSFRTESHHSGIHADGHLPLCGRHTRQRGLPHAHIAQRPCTHWEAGACKSHVDRSRHPGIDRSPCHNVTGKIGSIGQQVHEGVVVLADHRLEVGGSQRCDEVFECIIGLLQLVSRCRGTAQSTPTEEALHRGPAGGICRLVAVEEPRQALEPFPGQHQCPANCIKSLSCLAHTDRRGSSTDSSRGIAVLTAACRVPTPLRQVDRHTGQSRVAEPNQIVYFVLSGHVVLGMYSSPAHQSLHPAVCMHIERI